MILCCGEALIDMIPSATLAGPVGFVPHPGGAIFNTAIGLGRLGVKTALLSGVSNDFFGQQLVASLDASHVDTSFLIRSARPTTLAFVHVSAGNAAYTFFDENSAGRMIAPQALPDIPPEVTACYFGGISLCAEPAAETYLTLAQRQAARRAIVLDPNIRPGFISDPSSYRKRLQKFFELADIVKVSDDDLEWIEPGPQSQRQKVDQILKAGPSIVVLTKGDKGACAYLRDGSETVAQADVAEVVDTVGAGDTFNAGLLAKLAARGWLSKKSLATIDPAEVLIALRFGGKVAAITVSRAGANPPWRHEVS